MKPYFLVGILLMCYADDQLYEIGDVGNALADDDAADEHKSNDDFPHLAVGVGNFVLDACEAVFDEHAVCLFFGRHVTNLRRESLQTNRLRLRPQVP